MSNIDAFKIVPGTFICFECKRNAIELPGVCSACGDAYMVREFGASLQPALDSIPSLYSWTRGMLGSPEARERFRAAADQYVAEWKTIAPQLIEARNALLSGDVTTVVFYGPDSHFGKTSSAAIMLRRFIEDGRWHALSNDEKEYARTHDLSVPRWVAPEWRGLAHRIARARGARFVSAIDLQAPPGIIPEEVHQARHTAKTAPIIVLDDLGQECRGMHPNATNRPDLRGTQDVIHARSERRELLTIVTTWMNRAQMAEFFGANIQTRVFQKSFVICIGPNARIEDVR